ncbi:hypothetical protein QKU48_gp0878 [Fadolivirus algeromassiliense]|jgi:hypothetical protein|uniref:Uncharacterized protein n=1 Tax=Fadolivirus FV1/VV64 TaxID=3070911 RepID=A0A7D3V7S1_9VIRU|nr:hypothetical protein QKU48_gp0878 [Fadolivirus algeromassiliense]QKF94336.1 hypothetical protein Fadolivirus_1_878 [Fadolivirus FV1/VV64]
MEPDYIKPIILYDLFFTKPISNITKPQKENTPPLTFPSLPYTPVKRKKRTIDDYSLGELEQLISPNGKKILHTVPIEEQKELARALVEDVRLIESKEMEEYKNDPDYKEKLENNGLGFYMENFISFYGICPVCKENTLRKYSFSNMPVVDLICINAAYHQVHGGCFLYQVKTSLDDMYFNKTHNYISVGSKRFGYNSHIIHTNDDINKKRLVIGYICLYLNRVIGHDNKYNINKTKSFILLPNLQDQSGLYYYQYIDPIMGKNRIRWNSPTKIDDIEVCINNNTKVDTNDVFFETDVENPYIRFPADVLGDEWNQYKQKGIKYGGKRYKLVY